MPLRWGGAYNTYFTQFYPASTTLVLHSPIGNHRLALQFPNFKNSTLKYLRHETWMSSGVSVPPIIARPLRGAFGVLALARGT